MTARPKSMMPKTIIRNSIRHSAPSTKALPRCVRERRRVGLSMMRILLFDANIRACSEASRLREVRIIADGREGRRGGHLQVRAHRAAAGATVGHQAGAGANAVLACCGAEAGDIAPVVLGCRLHARVVGLRGSAR